MSKQCELGLDRPITCRDFIQGVAVPVGASLVVPGWVQSLHAAQSFTPEQAVDYYPPSRFGMRGSHEGSFEVRHQLRDQRGWDFSGATDTGERYDLLGMSLTPVAPTGSGSVSGGLPSHAPGARSALRDRASMPRVLDAAPLGAGVRVPRLRRDRGVAHRARAVDVRGLWTSGVGDRGHHFPGDPYSVVRLVPGDLVGGQPKKWRQRAWPTARARLGQLPHGVDVAAQAATRDGAAWPGPGVGGGRGGRDPRGRARRAEAADTWGRRRWWSLRPRCGAGPSAASGCSGWPMPQPTAC